MSIKFLETTVDSVMYGRPGKRPISLNVDAIEGVGPDFNEKGKTIIWMRNAQEGDCGFISNEKYEDILLKLHNLIAQ